MKKFSLTILWLDYNIAFSIDHIVKQGKSPLTSYFFWPRNDAWSQLKNELESKPWISEESKINILNKVTKIINYWQESSEKKSLAQAEKDFPCFIFHPSQQKAH